MRTPSSTAPDFVSDRAASAMPVLIMLALLFLTTSPAEAGEHTTIGGEYGKTGPASSGTGSGCSIAFQGANNRLYLFADNKIYGLQRSGPGSVAPIGGGFPITAVNSSCGDRDLAVDNTGGASANNIYAVPSSQSIYGWNSAGAALSAPWPVSAGGETCGVAVTNTGEVWGGNYGNKVVSKFTTAGAANGTISIGFSFCKLAINPVNNDLFVAPYSGSEPIVKLTAASGYTTKVNFPAAGQNNPGLTVNGTENRLYVTNNTPSVKAYDATTGALVETINVGGNAKDVAADQATDTLFVTVGEGASGVIKEFLAIKVPKATTGEPIGNDEVTGTADPNEAGDITECYFEFGLEAPAYGSKQNCAESLPITSPQAVHAILPGLVGEQTYHYRLVLATGAPGVVGKGADKTITPHNVQGLKTEAATSVTRTTAQLNGSFVGNGEATTYFFEYGTTTGYGLRSPASPTEKSAGSPPGPGATAMSQGITGLKPDTVYHFRVVAKNGIGTSSGKDAEFKTPVAVEGVTTEEATDETKNTATLNGSFTGNGEAHTFYFEWGPTTAYGHVIGGPAGSAVGKVSVSETISGLTPQLPTSTPYHYRLVATNSTGSTVGADRTFLPAPPDLPQISNTTTEDVSPTGANLSAMVNPGEGDTLVLFEYGPAVPYESWTPLSGSIGNDTNNHQVSATLTGLTPGTIYHFRAVAINYGGTSHGPDLTFTTPDVPEVASSEASSIGQTTAHLIALVAGNASPTHVHFEYGPSGAYGHSTSPIFAGQSLLGEPVASDVSGLAPGTTYHFRAVAANGIGTTNGSDLTFTTQQASPPPPKEEEPQKCRRGFVRRHGKCVRKQRRKHNRHSNRSHG